MKQGFSKEIAQKISCPQAPSTLKLYDAKWRVFARWCKEKNTDPFRADPPLVADFLMDRFKNHNARFKTLQGYRTVIAAACKESTGKDLGQDSRLSSLLKSLHRERPDPTDRFPAWDLAYVLFALTQPPFEPLKSIPLKNLTHKAVFLLTLASACRRGEIHALQKNVKFSQDWARMTLFPSPDFISKTQFTVNKGKPMDPVVVEALAPHLGPNLEEDKCLCPVRCLKVYLARTRELRTNKKLLFVSWEERYSADIKKNTITGWMRDFLVNIFKSNNSNAALLAKRPVHEIRAMASSLAFYGSVGLDDVVQACTWSSQSTFIDFYLRDLTLQSDELYSLCPLSVARNVIKKKS